MEKDFEVNFVYGYLYAKAEAMQESGLFKELTTTDLVKYLISTYKEKILLNKN